MYVRFSFFLSYLRKWSRLCETKVTDMRVLNSARITHYFVSFFTYDSLKFRLVVGFGSSAA